MISLAKIARGNKTKIVLFVNNVFGQKFSRKNAQKIVLFPSLLPFLSLNQDWKQCQDKPLYST